MTNFIIFLLSLGLVPTGAFILLYGTRNPWYKSQMGKAIFIQKTTLFIGILTILTNLLFPHTFLINLLSIIVLSLSNIAFWVMLYILLKEQSKKD